MASSRKSIGLTIINCLVLAAVSALLLYHVRATSQHTQNDVIQGDAEAGSRRQERSVDADDIPDLDGAKVKLVYGGDLLSGSNESQGGAVYTRWGRTTCNGPDTETVYSGVAGGSYYDHHGGGSNYLCMPKDPIWGNHNTVVNNLAIVYGAEYQLAADDFPFHPNPNAEKLADHNVPCVVCRSAVHKTTVMIPARTECYDTWSVEYSGYLMAGHHVHKGRFEFVCMDGQPEADPAGYRNENGALFYPAEGACGSLPCPPYVAGKELTCVVCSK